MMHFSSLCMYSETPNNEQTTANGDHIRLVKHTDISPSVEVVVKDAADEHVDMLTLLLTGEVPINS